MRQELSPQASTADRTGFHNPGNAGIAVSQGWCTMTVKIQLSPELYNRIRTLVHDELNERKNRTTIEQLGMKIRAQLDQLSSSNRSTGVEVQLRTVLHD